MSSQKTTITVAITIDAPVNKVWSAFNTPADITQWNSASPEWHTPKAENDLKPGGKFTYRMEAKDGSFGFDFGGTYDKVKTNKLIAYTLDDDRKVEILFDADGDKTTITTNFEAETQNSEEMQKGGWQAILDNFKTYVEAK